MRETYKAQSSRMTEIACTSPDEATAFDELLRDPSSGGLPANRRRAKTLAQSAGMMSV
jgi:hypothetical protein